MFNSSLDFTYCFAFFFIQSCASTGSTMWVWRVPSPASAWFNGLKGLVLTGSATLALVHAVWAMSVHAQSSCASVVRVTIDNLTVFQSLLLPWLAFTFVKDSKKKTIIIFQLFDVFAIFQKVQNPIENLNFPKSWKSKKVQTTFE